MLGVAPTGCVILDIGVAALVKRHRVRGKIVDAQWFMSSTAARASNEIVGVGVIIGWGQYSAQ